MNAVRAVKSLVAAVLVLAFVVLAAPAVVLADGRVALVVGNSAYDHIGRLPNPENDASDMSAALRRLGFEVTTELNADLSELTAALRAFTRRSTGADVALVFYAGHGMEMDGVNYLLPVDARVVRDTDVRYETLTLEDVLAATTGASLRMVILDACRDNPLARSMQRTVARRSISRGSFGDLDEALLGDETLVAYAAAAGTVADDGTGRNSPYTAALLEYLEEPLEIQTLFRQVRARVLAATERQQRPHEYASLVRNHYLREVKSPPPAEVRPPPADAAQVEVVFWESIRESTNPANFEAYKRRFPSGVFEELADIRIAALTAADPPRRPRPPAPAPTPEPAPAAAAAEVSRYQQRAEQGDAFAQYQLGRVYARGDGVPQDFQEALRWYRRAAEQGNRFAQYQLGRVYARGDGVPQDFQEALRWYRRAVEQGDAGAQNAIGRMYARGDGVPQDFHEALRWYQRAAAEGRSGYYAVVLADNYRIGSDGVPQDLQEAIRWYRRAVADGYDSWSRLASFRLGRLYERGGDGVPQDLQEAIRWYRRAAEQGYDDAREALDRLGLE